MLCHGYVGWRRSNIVPSVSPLSVSHVAGTGLGLQLELGNNDPPACVQGTCKSLLVNTEHQGM